MYIPQGEKQNWKLKQALNVENGEEKKLIM